ncbi:hypothetical protein J2785_003382 [Burkholderia ambifaria]|nr:hypothetical protein [Burkholderia ambifaria]
MNKSKFTEDQIAYASTTLVQCVRKCGVDVALPSFHQKRRSKRRNAKQGR